MTISTAATPLSFDGDDSTTAFSITWKYFAKADVVATLRDSAGAETIWILDTDYTLTAAGATGTLTATTAPATNETLVITLEPGNVQSESLPLGGPFPSGSVEDALDKLSQLAAKFQEMWNRTFRVPKTDTQSGSSLEIVFDSSRANKFMAFDANGDPIASTGPTGDSTIPVTSFIETLLDDASVVAARITLRSAGILQGSRASASNYILNQGYNHIRVTAGTGLIKGMTQLNTGEVWVLEVNVACTFEHLGTVSGGFGQLDLPGGNDIVAAAGDLLVFIYTANLKWELLSHRVNDLSGTWTPTIQDDSLSDSESQTYTKQFGAYTKIGNRVFISGNVQINSLGTLTTGQTARIAGLPFTSSSTSNSEGSIYVGEAASLNITAGQTVSGFISTSEAYIRLELWDNTAGTSNFLISELSAGARIIFSGQYIL